MPASQLEVITVSDDWTDEATCLFHLPTYKVSVVVGNVAVHMDFWEVPHHSRVDAGNWRESPEFVVPGVGSFQRPFLIGGLRFKNYVAGSGPAVISARAG